VAVFDDPSIATASSSEGTVVPGSFSGILLQYHFSQPVRSGEKGQEKG